jgi:hypothetical protein
MENIIFILIGLMFIFSILFITFGAISARNNILLVKRLGEGQYGKLVGEYGFLKYIYQINEADQNVLSFKRQIRRYSKLSLFF